MISKYWHQFWSLLDRVMEQLQANDKYYLSNLR